MASPSGSIDYWRRFFRCAGSDIFEIIEQAILVAATDHPEEFRSRRDRVGEKFYTALLRRCDRCDLVEPQGAEREEGRGSVTRVGEKESKVNSSIEDLECLNNPPAVLSNYTYDGEAYALTGDFQEEGQNTGEILRIKEILFNKDDESDDVLLASLRRLQQMEISVDVLKATEIGKAVGGIRRCNKSKQLCQLARTIVEGWKVMVDEWISANAAANTGTQDNSAVNDEGGLLDCEGNLHNIAEFGHSQKLEQRPRGKDETAKRSSVSAGLRTNLANEQKVGSSNSKAKPPQRKPFAILQNGSENADESAMKARLETTKRKLSQAYQQAENVKKQRTVQVLEPPVVPKQAQSCLPTIKIKLPFKLGSNGQ